MRWSEITVYVTIVLALALGGCGSPPRGSTGCTARSARRARSLDAQLVRRATVAAELATSGLLDPVSSVLVGEAAWAALSTGTASCRRPAQLSWARTSCPSVARPCWRWIAGGIESELSATLREALDDPDEVAALRADPAGDELVDLLASSWYRVQLARRFHNEAVAQTARARRGRLVRLLRLAGHAPEPRSLELDDAWPENLGRPGTRRGPARERPARLRRGRGARSDGLRLTHPAAMRPSHTARGSARLDVTSENSQPTTATHAGVIGTARVKRGMAEMLKGGVIMDVVNAEQAKIAEDAGAVAVMALERVPADIRAQGGVARMSDPDLIDGIIEAVSIPVMAKARIGHFVEAQVLAVARRRLHRRVRGADPGRLRAPHRQVGASRCPSSAVPPTWARRCAASPRARR